MIRKLLLYFYLILLIASCQTRERKIYLGQGMMAGEATDNSIILQSRLTASDTLLSGDVPGHKGVAQFEISESPTFANAKLSGWMQADSLSDFIVKHTFNELKRATTYYYRLRYGPDRRNTSTSKTHAFKTNAGSEIEESYSMVVVTGMNYYHFHFGKYDSTGAYSGNDKALGYPALVAIKQKNPDYFIGTGDNVYFDHPSERDFQRALERGQTPHPGLFDGKEVVDEEGMRRKYHVQFYQPRYLQLFTNTSTYWEKDDHDYRMNDADPFMDFPISHELGIKNFREQLPVVTSGSDEPTYRTRRISKDLQLWFVEGRDFRDANDKPPGPDKTLWGKEQLDWLKTTLLQSDATFKLLISPTPMVGPDDAYKRDNHVNPEGFRDEGEAFFEWLVSNDLIKEHFYIVCGDRHWQYHARHPLGIEEFSCGALVDNNSRAGRLAGDPNSTDPDGLIEQYYVQGTPEQASGGFLYIKNTTGEHPMLHFEFYDENGRLLYENVKKAG